MTTTTTPSTPAALTPAAASSPTHTPGPRHRWRETLGSAAFEATFVVLGVVLALAANEWREARIHREEGESAKLAIVNELQQNRRLLDSSRAYHARLTSGIFAAPPTQTFSPDYFRNGFIMPAQVSSTAWEVASETGALAHIPYDQVLAISQVVAMQRRYDAMSVSTGQLIYSELYRIGPAGMVTNARNLAAIIGAFSYRERLLITQIDSTLAALKR